MATKVTSRPIDQTKLASIADVSSYMPTLETYGPRSPLFFDDGLGFAAGWDWAYVRNEAGKEFMLVRWLGIDTSVTYAVLETAPDIWGTPVPRFGPIPGIDNLYGNEVRWHHGDDMIEMVGHSPFYPALSSKHFADHRVEWREAEFCDLRIDLWGEAMRFTVPGPPHNVGYTSQMGPVTGTVDGHRVVWGHGGLDRSYMPFGMSFYDSKVHLSLEELWVTWSTPEVDHHPREMGVIITGPGDFAVCYHQVEGEQPACANALDVCEIDWQEKDGRVLPAGVRFGFAGREFVTEHTGTNQIPGADLNMDWLTGTTRQANRDGAAECRTITEFFKHLQPVE